MVIAASVGSDVFRAFLQGLPAGAVYSLVALGFVLTYKTSGVFNLAFGAQAYASAAMYFKAREVWGWGIIPALVLSVVVMAPLIGLVLERLIFRSLRTAGPVPRLVVTIGLAVAIPNLFNLLANYRILSGVTPPGIVPNGAGVFYNPFGSYAFTRDELVAMGIALVGMALLFAVFRFSAIGLRMRAVVESSRMTELNGIAADRVSAFAWGLSSLFAGLAGVLIAPRYNSLSANDFFSLVVVAIAAAAIGRLSSLPLTLLGGFLLGDLIAQMNTFVPRWSATHAWLRPIQTHLTPAVPFVVLFAVLVFVPAIRRSRDAGDPLAGVDPPPAQVAAAAAVDARRQLLGRLAGVAALIAVGAVVFTRADQAWMFLVTEAVIIAIVFLSVTVIIGMAGQISLCQGAFAATGAYTVFQMNLHHTMPLLAAMLLGGVIAGALAVLVWVPIQRLGGVWTALATLAFAYFFDTVLVNLPFVNGGDKSLIKGSAVDRPVFGPIDFASDKSFLLLAIVLLAIVAVAVYQLRGGTLGRALVALRGSEVAAASIGISAARARLAAFAVSGFIAGIGGALLAMHQENVNYGNNFTPFAALFWVVIVVVLGARSISGALNAAGSFALFDAVVLKGAIFAWILRSPDRIPGFLPLAGSWVFVLFGLAAVQFAHNPNGLIEGGAQKRAAKKAARAARAARAEVAVS